MFLKHFQGGRDILVLEDRFAYRVKNGLKGRQAWSRESSRMDIAETDNVGWTRGGGHWKYREQV